MAQQPSQALDEKKQGPEKTHAAEPKPGARTRRPNLKATATKPHGAKARAGSVKGATA